MHDADGTRVVHAKPAGGEGQLEGLEAAGLERPAMAGSKPRVPDLVCHVVGVPGGMRHVVQTSLSRRRQRRSVSKISRAARPVHYSVGSRCSSVDPPHDRQIDDRHRTRIVVQAATADPQQLGLTAQCQPVAAVDHRFALGSGGVCVGFGRASASAFPIGAGHSPGAHPVCGAAYVPAPVRSSLMMLAEVMIGKAPGQCTSIKCMRSVVVQTSVRFRTLCGCPRGRRVQWTASVQKIVLLAVARVQETGHATPAGKLAAGYPPKSKLVPGPARTGPALFVGSWSEAHGAVRLDRGFGHPSGVANFEAARITVVASTPIAGPST